MRLQIPSPRPLPSPAGFVVKKESYIFGLISSGIPVPVSVIAIDYPLYFTPNGDGNHDTWNIEGIGSSAKIRINLRNSPSSRALWSKWRANIKSDRARLSCSRIDIIHNPMKQKKTDIASVFFI